MKILKTVSVPLNEECLNRNCRHCKDQDCIIEAFTLLVDDSGVKHVTNEFMCKNCRNIIEPNSKNGYKTVTYSANFKKFLKDFTERNIRRDVFGGEIYQKDKKNALGFKKCDQVYIPDAENVLEQYTLDLDGFTNDDSNVTVCTFDADYNPELFLIPRDALNQIPKTSMAI